MAYSPRNDLVRSDYQRATRELDDEMSELPSLPAWQLPPADERSAVREIKQALRRRIAASGRSVEEVFGEIEALIADRVTEVRAANAAHGTAWPSVDYSEIASGTISGAVRDLVRRRGCLVVRGHFAREQALSWDRSLVDYLDSNRFDEIYRGPGDDFFATVGSKPEIFPIYWSHAQMEARQSERMATVQRLLNSMWRCESEGSQWFDPERSAFYPDRVRRRPEGTTSAGLGNHIDAGTLDLWMKAEYQQAFRHVFDGSIEQFDPWDAAYRTEGSQYPGTTMTSAFRTFQGWTALSDMQADQGVLRSVPIPEAIAYLLLRPLLDDVPDDDMCGVTVSKTFPVTDRWHSVLLEGVSGLPDVQAGDSVWWHGDMIHGVASVTDQQGWGNVMYIPAAPWCSRNEVYAATALEAFRTGSSPDDFPEEHYERLWDNRFHLDDLNEYGRQALGLADAAS